MKCIKKTKYRNIICHRGGGIQLATVVNNKLKLSETPENTGCPFCIQLKNCPNGQWIVRQILNQHNHRMDKDAQPEYNEVAQLAISKIRAELGAEISMAVKNFAYYAYFRDGIDIRQVVAMCADKFLEEKPKEDQIINYIQACKKLPGDNPEIIVDLAKYLHKKKETVSELDFKARKDLRFICWTTIQKNRRPL